MIVSTTTPEGACNKAPCVLHHVCTEDRLARHYSPKAPAPQHRGNSAARIRRPWSANPGDAAPSGASAPDGAIVLCAHGALRARPPAPLGLASARAGCNGGNPIAPAHGG